MLTVDDNTPARTICAMGETIVRLNRNGEYWLARWVRNGKRYHRSLGRIDDLSKRAAEVHCRRIQAELDSGTAITSKAPRLSEWCDTYLRLRTDLSPSARTIADHTARYLKAYFDHDPGISRIESIDAAEWRAALKRGELAAANRYPIRKPDAPKPPPVELSDATVAKHVRAAKRMFAEAVKLKLLAVNPFADLSGRAPDVEKDWAVVTPADLQKIMDECPDDAWRMLFALCRYAGLRRGEALRLQWRDILWQHNKIVVNARVRRGTKKRTRICPIEPSRLPTGLTALLLAAHERSCGDLVCPGINPNTIDQNARRIIQRAGKVYSDPFHCLRRNREAELAAEYPMHVFAEWQGHSPDVAARYYLRVEDSLYAPPPGLAKKLAKTESELP